MNRFFRRAAPTPETIENAKQWRLEHPEESTWIDSNVCTNTFARSLYDNLNSFGRLTENQISAVHRNIQRKIELQKEQESKKVILSTGAQAILTCLQVAKDNGVKRPKLRTEKIDFSLAKEGSRNSGYVYVKSNYTYLGKINPKGDFYPSKECTDNLRVLVSEIALDPLQAAIQYGRISGACSCCGKQLDNPESVRLGIGPVCRKKYFNLMENQLC